MYAQINSSLCQFILECYVLYLLNPRECVYRGRAWSAIKNTISESSIVAARIVLNMVNIPRVLNETLIDRHLKAMSISN